jgi:hypothetical protein
MKIAPIFFVKLAYNVHVFFIDFIGRAGHLAGTSEVPMLYTNNNWATYLELARCALSGRSEGRAWRAPA